MLLLLLRKERESVEIWKAPFVMKVKVTNPRQSTFPTALLPTMGMITAIFPQQGLPTWRGGKEPSCHCRRHKRHGFDSWVGKIPWRRKWQPTPVFLPGKSHRQRSLVGYSLWGHKQSDATEHTCTAYLGGGTSNKQLPRCIKPKIHVPRARSTCESGLSLDEQDSQ